MTGVRGVVAAGGIAVVLTGAHAVHLSWPAMYGTEIYVPAALVRQPTGMPLVAVRLPFAQIALDVPHTTPPLEEPVEPLARLGDWWIAGGDGDTMARRLRGRPLHVQLEPGGPLWTGGAAGMRARTVSDAVVSGATNLSGTVTSVREDGYLTLDFGFAPIAVPEAVAARARPMADRGARRARTGPIPPPADPGVAAVLRVLPSGRAVLAGIIVNGKRY